MVAGGKGTGAAMDDSSTEDDSSPGLPSGEAGSRSALAPPKVAPRARRESWGIGTDSEAGVCPRCATPLFTADAATGCTCPQCGCLLRFVSCPDCGGGLVVDARNRTWTCWTCFPVRTLDAGDSEVTLGGLTRRRARNTVVSVGSNGPVPHQPGTTDEVAKRPLKAKAMDVWYLLLAVAVASVVVGLLAGIPSGEHYGPTNALASAGIITVMLMGILAMMKWMWKFMGDTIDAAIRASVPVPPREELRAQLVSELGREPSLEEIAALQQILMNERAQDAVRAAAGVAFYLQLRHVAKGRGR